MLSQHPPKNLSGVLTTSGMSVGLSRLRSNKASEKKNGFRGKKEVVGVPVKFATAGNIVGEGKWAPIQIKRPTFQKMTKREMEDSTKKCDLDAAWKMNIGSILQGTTFLLGIKRFQ